jgi:AhpD family alkylhydroperoxidase
MMLDWNAYHAQILKTLAELGRMSPDTLRGYRTLSEAGNRTQHLDPKVRELIALAVAVTEKCDGCIVVHTEAALKHGATHEEITEALGVAIAVNAGAALIFSTRVLDAWQRRSRHRQREVSLPAGGSFVQ